MDTLLPLFVAVPLAAAALIPLTARKLPWTSDVLALAAMTGLLALSIMTINQTGIYAMGANEAPMGIELRLDGLSSLLLLAINVIGFCLALYSVSYMRMYTSKLRYFMLFLLLVTGVNGVALSSDLFNLFVFMEIASIASYALVGFGCESDELEASFKYLVLGSVGSAFVFFGIALTYAMTGTLSMAHLAAKAAAAGTTAPPMLLAIAFFVFGFGLKAALVPFHAWLPDAHPSAPAPVSAMLSGVVIKSLGVYVLARLLFNVFGADHAVLALLQWLAVVSMVVGGMLSIGQWDMKRLFAYSSVSQMGYVVLGLALATPLGIVGGLYHLLNHSVSKSLLFLNAGAVQHATGTRDLRQLGGLNKAMPVTGFTSLIASMSVAGVPPFGGFWSKLIIVLACVASGKYLFALIAVAMSLVTLGLLLKVQKQAFFDSLRSAADSIKRTPVFMGLAMVILALIGIGTAFFVVGGFNSPWVVGPAADALTAGRFRF